MIAVALLVMNALFWGLFPHSAHCGLVGWLGVAKCPSHWIHISMGVVFFLCAVLVAQWRH
jgi:hypothetical protein